MHRLVLLLALIVLLPCSVGARAQPAPSVLYVSSERLADLALGHPHIVQVARLGFGTPGKPWHTWFGGSPELQLLVHLPGYQPGAPVRLSSTMLVGNRFQGKVWTDAFAALASFDADGNGIVEGRELSELFIWVDFDADGQVADRDDSLRPASFYYGGFDLRQPAITRSGHARQGRIRPFSALVPYGSRSHLLELQLGPSYASRLQAYLPQVPQLSPGTQAGAGQAVPRHPLAGRWRWRLTNEAQWTDATRPWGPQAAGQLLLAVSQDRIHGVVQYLGPHEDRINLPLQGQWRGGRAAWTSVSPLGLTRSEVRLESLYGRPVLRGRSFSNRNGRLSEWTWEARHDGPIE
jgi:hypothetical protein